MGYTHYWHRPKEIPRTAFKLWVNDVFTLVTAFNTPVVRVQREFNKATKPMLGPSVVSFNGVGDAGHETFYVERVFVDPYGRGAGADGTFFAFCKTAQKPYDPLVVACLAALKHHFPEVKVSSDGEMDEWREGLSLYQSLKHGDDYVVSEKGLGLRNQSVSAVHVT